jgi:chromate transporter
MRNESTRDVITPNRQADIDRSETVKPSLAEATLTWGKIGVLSFGGPAAQIGLMHRLIVDEKRWLSEAQFLNALSFCMLLPGPEAMQLATYAGWRLHGIVGGLIAGLLFVLPGALVMLGLGLVYVFFGTLTAVNAIFFGIKAAITVIVLQALIRLAGKTLQERTQMTIAALSFVAIFLLKLPFPLIIATAAAHGFARNYKKSQKATKTALPSTISTCWRIALWLTIWWTPILAVDVYAGTSLLADIGYFFSKLAIVTFGGAYAVLAYMAQDVVDYLGWLSPSAMMDGLGLAETTPGPLILVTEFVGFVAAFNKGGVWLGMAGAAIALWATFVPCFLWIFAGAPYVDWLIRQPRLQGVLSSIMAAVVGVMANLFLWFTLHLLFARVIEFPVGPMQLLIPDATSLDWRLLVVALVCGWMVFSRHINVFLILAVAAVGGIIVTSVFGAI